MSRTARPTCVATSNDMSRDAGFFAIDNYRRARPASLHVLQRDAIKLTLLSDSLTAMKHFVHRRILALRRTGSLVLFSLLLATGLLLSGCGTESRSDSSPEMQDRPHVAAASPVDAGRYLVTVAGCNDCHTKGYLQTEGDVPEEDWLTGNPVGWRGPWGTTYASNLRLYADTLSAGQFVKILHSRTALPPMPWMNINEISERDARAIYAYLKHLGPKGKPTPENVPPGKEPNTPYIRMAPPRSPSATASGDMSGE